MNKVLLGIVALLIVLGVLGTFYYGKNQEKKISPAAIPTITSTSKTPSQTSPAPSSTAEFVNPSATIFAAEESVKAKDYTGLDTYMTDKVSVILAASECCGTLSKGKTLDQIKYLNQGTAPWDFSDANPIAKKLESADPSNFKGRIIGTAANGFTVSFNLNDKFLIDKIFMVSNYKLIAP